MRLPTRLAAVLVGLLSAPALASDGVLEINQACATGAGCFIGDAPGFPVTIGAKTPAKSIRLTSDLVVDTVDDTAISVETSLARIDLGGFAIRGPVTCSGAPLVCSGSGVGDGIAVLGAAQEGVEVRNGAVSGMGRRGVFVGASGVVENVRATQNADVGVLTGGGGVVRGCSAFRNGEQGFRVGTGSQLLSNVAERNGFVGIDADLSAVLVGNTSRENGLNGIQCSIGCVVENNVARANAGNGLVAQTGSVVSGNSVTSNGLNGIVCGNRCNVDDKAVSFNGATVADDAIECGAACSVRGNQVAVAAGRGFALNLSSTSMYRENVLDAGGSGSVDAGVNGGDNFCTGAGAILASCP